MTTLKQQLEEKTQDLKEQYIEQTKVWASASHKRAEFKCTWNEAAWCTALGLEPVSKKNYLGTEYLTFPEGFYNSKQYRTYDAQKSEAQRIAGMGLGDYTEKEVKLAVRHYNDSLDKLVYRLNQKGVMDGSEFIIKTARVGVNLEITIEHGTKTTRAWTIVAEGEIQRPHYRYLVK